MEFAMHVKNEDRFYIVDIQNTATPSSRVCEAVNKVTAAAEELAALVSEPPSHDS